MPLILSRGDDDFWLDVSDPVALVEVLKQSPTDAMEACLVSSQVILYTNESPEVIRPMARTANGWLTSLTTLPAIPRPATQDASRSIPENPVDTCTAVAACAALGFAPVLQGDLFGTLNLASLPALHAEGFHVAPLPLVCFHRIVGGDKREGNEPASHTSVMPQPATLRAPSNPQRRGGLRYSREALAVFHAVCRYPGYLVCGTELILFFIDERFARHINRFGTLCASSDTPRRHHGQCTDLPGLDVRNHITEHRVQSTIHPGLGRRGVSSDTTMSGALQAYVEPDRLECIRSIQHRTGPGIGSDMSYVHDVFLDMDFDRAAFAAAVEDIRTLFRRAELPVVGPSGRPLTPPILEDDFIAFNGRNRGCTCDPEGLHYHNWDPAGTGFVRDRSWMTATVASHS